MLDSTLSRNSHMPREAFRFATEPLSHQDSYFGRVRNRESFSNNWEQGLGKSKCCIDEASWLYSKGQIDGILVLAPNGVHANWIDDEIPKHLHESVAVTTHTYYSQKAKTQKAKKALQACIDATLLLATQKKKKKLELNFWSFELGLLKKGHYKIHWVY